MPIFIVVLGLSSIINILHAMEELESLEILFHVSFLRTPDPVSKSLCRLPSTAEVKDSLQKNHNRIKLGFAEFSIIPTTGIVYPINKDKDRINFSYICYEQKTNKLWCFYEHVHYPNQTYKPKNRVIQLVLDLNDTPLFSSTGYTLRRNREELHSDPSKVEKGDEHPENITVWKNDF